ncbi:hypothetical protein [Xenorhabdus bharatensis]|uniref:hypothetical protein n=1 Tax=Xenorhabdus bharatensis TaxID=3136256 RepID=UPI0030F3EF51
MSQSAGTHDITVAIKYDTGALSQLESQLEHIVELLDRIHGRRYDEDMTLAVDKGVVAESFKLFDSEKKRRVAIPPLRETIYGPVQTTEIINDDHLRQIVREELRQFVARESERGGLLSKW